MLTSFFRFFFFNLFLVFSSWEKIYDRNRLQLFMFFACFTKSTHIHTFGIRKCNKKKKKEKFFDRFCFAQHWYLLHGARRSGKNCQTFPFRQQHEGKKTHYVSYGRAYASCKDGRRLFYSCLEIFLMFDKDKKSLEKFRYVWVNFTTR